MVVPNPEYYPLHPLQEKQITAGDDLYQTPDWVLDVFPDWMGIVADEIYDGFNKNNGTDYKFKLKN